MEVMSVIISIAAICISTLVPFIVYKWTIRDSMKIAFLNSMLDIYYKIEEDAHVLIESERNKGTIDEIKIEQCVRRIKVSSALLQYYLKRIPGYSESRTELGKIAILIEEKPQWIDGYPFLSNVFETFFYTLSKNKKDANTHIFSLKNLGYPQKKL